MNNFFPAIGSHSIKITKQGGHQDRAEADSKVPDWGKSRLWHMVKVDSGIGLPNAHGKRVGVDSGVDIR